MNDENFQILQSANTFDLSIDYKPYLKPIRDQQHVNSGQAMKEIQTHYETLTKPKTYTDNSNPAMSIYQIQTGTQNQLSRFLYELNYRAKTLIEKGNLADARVFCSKIEEFCLAQNRYNDLVMNYNNLSMIHRRLNETLSG
jgi:hypothetical protein